ncbi:SMP-30/gluconolactonase/LRE family protein [Flammeovirga pectinis]|uniref:SMP-30/gluconolactonase/LRE family protein n=1 Tax=Flammeovirga pectinis TaxID=2494373 RepID=A0A3Q9FP84_9BACT|nr:SMP-30/gluconolactonase/LRE family protein [Flammeovirga pectinis]AZQ61696.1 SMP-30/gluconolactonase/LRE family protein [Flammeovirga pectinis]
MKQFKNTLFSLSLLFITSFILQACSLKPLAWTPPEKPKLEGNMAVNNLLQSTEWIDLQGWVGPEDIAIDKEGNLYCGVHVSSSNFDEGRILKIDTNGEVTTFCNTDAWVTGLVFDKNQQLIACDQKRGIISVNPKGKITVLASKDEYGRPFLIPNDVDIAENSIIYFSSTSSKMTFSKKNARKLLMEVKADGGLYSYDPSTKKVKTLIDGAYFGNGVAVSKDNDFVLMVDLTKYRIMRYWITGKYKGTTDIFIDNLPGIPNGVSKRKDGSFWVGFSTRRSDILDKIQPNTTLKKIIYSTPMWLQPKQEAFGMLMHLSSEGTIMKTYYDTTGVIVSEASSVEEHNGFLYIGGDLTTHIGKYTL